MEVVVYQLVIVLTIALAYWSRPRLGLLAAIGWSAESAALLSYPPLIVIQIFVVWSTYFVLRAFAAKTRLIENLLRHQAASTRERVLLLDASDLEMIDGGAHTKILQDAVASCRESLCVLSGWISDSVLDTQMIQSIELALQRGVDVYLGYGYKDIRGIFDHRPSSQRALRALRALRDRSATSPGSLHVARIGTHEKMLVQDTQYFACGSHNWLSNAWFINSERSVLVRRKDFSRDERDRIQKLVIEHAS